MKTDIPLKRLAELRGSDLLPLLGVPATAIRHVATLELPASAERLDTALTLESPGGQEYLLVVEWQGYRDFSVLWRLASYCARIGQRMPTLPIVGCVVYLAPAFDIGDSLRQVVDGMPVQTWPVHVVRLWEHDAAAAVASGALGLMVLSPLMANASAQLVEAAAQAVLRDAPDEQQADLLVILGIFGEPIIPLERFIRLVGKEQLMASDLVSYLMEEQNAEREARSIERLQRTLEGLIALRFPEAPLRLAGTIHSIADEERLHQLVLAVGGAADIQSVEAALNRARIDESRLVDPAV
jgi:hypothetical protein